MKTEYEYIRFELGLTQPPKTSRWVCLNMKSNIGIGHIQFYPQWRRYCFFPAPTSVFSAGCLNDISHFIGQLMDWRVTK